MLNYASTTVRTPLCCETLKATAYEFLGARSFGLPLLAACSYFGHQLQSRPVWCLLFWGTSFHAVPRCCSLDRSRWIDGFMIFERTLQPGHGTLLTSEIFRCVPWDLKPVGQSTLRKTKKPESQIRCDSNSSSNTTLYFQERRTFQKAGWCILLDHSILEAERFVTCNHQNMRRKAGASWFEKSH